MTSVRWIAVGCLLSLVHGVAVADPSGGDAQRPTKRIVMIAGPRSHNYGAHEHYAGLKILARSIADDDVSVKVVRGWPEDDAPLDSADAIVFFADGGGRHPAIPHLDKLESLAARGVGLAAIHYAVETVPGETGNRWLELMGGHFEIHKSVNPHWTAELQTDPAHPVTAGIAPFKTLDEWYFNLRFKGSGVTPLLQAVAPESTMRRRDGHHSGNPEVRKLVADGATHTLAWAYERPGDGGRSFGITGGHFHWVWGNDAMREVTARGIRWVAGLSPAVPESAPDVSVDDLLQNQDYERPDKFKLDTIRQYID